MIEDGLFILLFLIIFVVIGIFLIIHIKSESKYKNITNYVTNYHSGNSCSEFEKDDIDKDVDEMPDDCLIYDELFDDPLFPLEFTEEF